MEEVRYHSYPDVNVTKDVLIEEHFPMSTATLNRRLRVMRGYRQFRSVEIRSAGKILINVRGFFMFLEFLDKKRK